jgi:hypothetical protein
MVRQRDHPYQVIDPNRIAHEAKLNSPLALR